MRSTIIRCLVLFAFLFLHGLSSQVSAFRVPARLERSGIFFRTSSSGSNVSGGGSENSSVYDGRGHHHEKSKDDTSAENKPRKIVTLVIGKRWAKFLYILSCLNPTIAVLYNDYTKMLEPFPSVVQTQKHNIITQTVGGFFQLVRLRPRVSFAVGAMLRALQLTTAFQQVIDPTAGVGFGLNSICLFAKSRWPATIFLGWSLTEPFWKMLGARPPTTSPVPITVAFKKNAKEEYVGYRIGL